MKTGLPGNPEHPEDSLTRSTTGVETQWHHTSRDTVGVVDAHVWVSWQVPLGIHHSASRYWLEEMAAAEASHCARVTLSLHRAHPQDCARRKRWDQTSLPLMNVVWKGF